MSRPSLPTRGALAKAGLLETDAAIAALAVLPTELAEATADVLGECADPDAALAAWSRLFATHPDALAQITAGRLRGLLKLLGASPVFVEHLSRHVEDLEHIEIAMSPDYEWDASRVRSALIAHVGDGAREMQVARLRRRYRQYLIHIAVRDVVCADEVDVTWLRLSDLADAALGAALHVAMSQNPSAAQRCQLAVVAMGKCGAQELNYVSDVDVMFVCAAQLNNSADHIAVDGAHEDAGELELEGADDGHDSALAAASQLAADVMRVCIEPNIEAPLWTVDANLRPEGRMGALVRTLPSYADYYARWAKPWEYQALLKARFVAGSMELGDQFVHMAQGFVWRAASEPRFVAEARRLRQRVETDLGDAADREIKLGPGGLRDVEFSVQLLQLVHGRHDESLRVPGTLAGLNALAAGGYVGREDASALEQTYRFLRTLEHRLQLRRLQRTHMFPSDDRDIRWLARSVGMVDDPVANLTSTWRAVATDARQRHIKLFYRPLLDALTRAEPGIARLSTDAARERYAALGFTDPEAAMRHVEALSGGVSRKAAIQRALMPVVLAWLAESPLPDAGLLAFRRVSESLGDSPWYLRSLRDESQTAQRLITVLGTSRWLTELLLAAPESVAMLGTDEDLRPRSIDELLAEMTAVVNRADDAALAVASVRAIRRRELWRIGCADLLGLIDVAAVGESLTSVMQATLQAALMACEREQSGDGVDSLAIIAMGRFGGRELGYGSDADVMFTHLVTEPAGEPVANQACIDVLSRMRALLSAPSPEPRVDLDADLRPEGRNGPLVRTADSYAAYYAQWAKVWESQALVRATYAAGNSTSVAELLIRIHGVRWPASGLAPAEVTEIRRLKARMESERLPRGVDPTSHLKLGPGGLSDVEWTVQLLQLQHAHRVPALQTTGTLIALHAATEAGLLTQADARELEQAWIVCTRIRNYQVLVSGRATDVLPTDVTETAALAAALGFDSAEELRQEHAKVRRLARKVMERVFYDVAD